MRNNKQVLVGALLCALCLQFAAARANAQVLYGSIVGDVTDVSKAAVPGAAVRITNQETNQSRVGVTNDAGKGNVHSVAADPVTNQVYVPINNGAGAASHICSSHGGVDANGCIAVYTTTNDDPGSCFQQGGSEANCPPRQAARR